MPTPVQHSRVAINVANGTLVKQPDAEKLMV